MRKRHYRARVWLDKNEYTHFFENVSKSGLSKEVYLRKLISCHEIKESPPLEYFDILRQLLAIGKNINQIAVVANSLGFVDSSSYAKNYSDLLQLVLMIQKIVEI